MALACDSVRAPLLWLCNHISTIKSASNNQQGPRLSVLRNNESITNFFKYVDL